MMTSCLFLSYSAYVVPMQLSFWINDDDPCQSFSTLYSDIVVDTYFLVLLIAAVLVRTECIAMSDFES